MEEKGRLHDSVFTDPQAVINNINDLLKGGNLDENTQSWLLDKLTLAHTAAQETDQKEAYQNLDTFQLLSIRNHIVQYLVKLQPKVDLIISESLKLVHRADENNRERPQLSGNNRKLYFAIG
jgi:hypothetical protein